MKKYFIILFLTFFLSCEKCEKFKRNPNLELLIKDNWNSFFNPVWSPDGKNIYYLRAHRDNLPVYGDEIGIGGELWKINLDTRKKTFLLIGPFCSLAISPSGDLLALSYEIKKSSFYFEGGPLILVDTAGNILDTLPTSLPLILDVEFSFDGSKLYYYAYDTIDTGIPFGFYKINIDGTNEELVKEDRKILEFMEWGLNFDLDKNDSLIYGKIDTLAYKGFFYHPQILYRENNKYIIFCTGPIILADEPLKIKLVNASSHILYHVDAAPYKYSSFESCYWSFDGKKLIISAGEFQAGDVSEVENLELWILHKVWEEEK
jgi:hypothetical protein